MCKIIIQIILFIFPWPLRRKLMILIFNFEIHPTARIGYSILLCKKLELHSNTKIRHLNFCKKIDKIVLKEYSTIGSLNFITGFSTGNNDFALKNKINTSKALKWAEKNSNAVIVGFKDLRQLKEILNQK